MADQHRVVVTGLGVATPVGLGIEATWEAMLAGRCGLDRIQSFDASGLGVQVGGELPDFKFGDFIPKTYRKSVKVMARDIVIAVVAAYYAATDAGLNTKCIIDRGEAEGPPNLDSTRFGANIGAGLICADLDELASSLTKAADDDGKFSLNIWGAEAMQTLTPLWLLKFLPNMLACHVTIVHDAQAPSNTITCGEASSHLAIGEAFRTISRGDADVCICGGAESKINPMAIARHELIGWCNVDRDVEPAAVSRPFSASARGGVASEGGGLIILENLQHAKKRGARLYAELVGFGAACSTHSLREPDPNGLAVQQSIQKGLADANLSAGDVSLAVPFGVGDASFDAGEAAGWKAALGNRLAEIPALTSRGAMGISGAGTGAIDFALTAMSLHQRSVPPSINTGDAAPGSPFAFAVDGPQDANLETAITTSQAIVGGQCAALVLKRFEESA